MLDRDPRLGVSALVPVFSASLDAQSGDRPDYRSPARLASDDDLSAWSAIAVGGAVLAYSQDPHQFHTNAPYTLFPWYRHTIDRAIMCLLQF